MSIFKEQQHEARSITYRKYHWWVVLLAITVSPFGIADVAGSKTYITDILYVPVRSGQGNQYRIINKGIKSGTPLTIIDKGTSADWTKIRTDGGLEGWVRSQYLVSTPPATRQLKQLTKETQQSRETRQRLERENAALSANTDTLGSQLEEQQLKCAAIENNLKEIRSVSAKAIETDTLYRKLLEEHKLMEAEREALAAENEQFKNDKKVHFMFYGAGIFVLGMLMAIILPALRPPRQYSEWR